MSTTAQNGRAGRRRVNARLITTVMGVSALLGGFTVIGFVTPAGASGNLYVSPYGSDASNSCTVKADPCLTLQHAYNKASAGETINLSAGTFRGGLNISMPITIAGVASSGSLDATNTTINAGGAQNVLDIDSAGSVTVSNVVVTGGVSDGGVVSHNSDVTLDNVTVSDNTTTLDGGGIFTLGGTFTMDGGSVTGNVANDLFGGGGLFVYSGTVTVHDVTFTHNSATGSGTNGYGGGIFNKAGTLKLTGTTAVHDNFAATSGGGVVSCTPGSTTDIGSGVSISANAPNQVSTTSTAAAC
jgi:hypothetical protein